MSSCSCSCSTCTATWRARTRWRSSRRFDARFRPSEPVRLILKCVNAESDPAGSRAPRDRAAGAAIDIHRRLLSPPTSIRGLMSSCDAYVSLHRSEGIGLTIADAMGLGKPVIATGWSGNTDFMDVSNAFPVGYRLVDARRERRPVPRGRSVGRAIGRARRRADALGRRSPDEARARGAAARETHRSATTRRSGVAELVRAAAGRHRRAAPVRRVQAGREGAGRGYRDLVRDIREVVGSRRAAGRRRDGGQQGRSATSCSSTAGPAATFRRPRRASTPAITRATARPRSRRSTAAHRAGPQYLLLSRHVAVVARSLRRVPGASRRALSALWRTAVRASTTCAAGAPAVRGMSTVLVAASIATKSRNGGNARAVLNWVHGLAQLGVTRFTSSRSRRHTASTTAAGRCPAERERQRAYFEHVMRDAGFDAAPRSSATAVTAESATIHGAIATELLDWRAARPAAEHHRPPHARTADATVPPEGVPRSRSGLHAVLARGGARRRARLDGHDFHFTIGENIGTPDCCIPTGGIRWRHTRQPVVLDDGACDARRGRGGSRRSRAGAARTGRSIRRSTTFGLKVHEFRKLIDLPRASRRPSSRSRSTFIQATQATWMRCAARMARRRSARGRRIPEAFDDYILGSDAECSAAQGVYVRHKQRLVQRSDRAVSGRGKTGARAGHRLRWNPSG